MVQNDPIWLGLELAPLSSEMHRRRVRRCIDSLTAVFEGRIDTAHAIGDML